MRSPSAHTVELLRAAIADPDVVARYRAKVVVVEGSDCAFWTGSLSSRGYGRFFLGRVHTGEGRQGVGIIAHRFAYALAYGVDALLAAPVLSHRCDEPLCQRIGPRHLVAATARSNRREWAARRHLAGNPLGDRRSARGRAVELRRQILDDPSGVRDCMVSGLPIGVQPPLF